ncbi:MAG: radical SAM protein [Eubacterium sp.]|nr:radical SAM protein [Eubacterium sp.]
MYDNYQRNIDYFRISITDRCNLRCRYCMPEGIPLISMDQILRYEEILAICTEAVSLGIRKYKITGGEPLVRIGCADLIREMKKIPGVEQVTITTNKGFLAP